MVVNYSMTWFLRSFADGESSFGPTVEVCNLFLKTCKSLNER